MSTLLSPSQECHPFTPSNLAHDLVVSAGAGKIPMMPLLIYQQMTFNMNWPLGAAQAVTLMVLVLALLSLYGIIVRRLPALR
jgi:ABC-type spermidine/putrescine transport system permease subunit I